MYRIATALLPLIFLSLLPRPCSAQPGPVGLWDFDDPGDLTAATLGQDLARVGSDEAVPGSEAGDGAARIGVGSHYICTHGIAGNGGGSLVNEYTLVFDLQTFGRGMWHCLLQTNESNANDGDVFINQPGRVGVSATGYSWPRMLDAKTWYRMVVVVDNGSRYEIYVDGLRILDGAVQGVDGRFSLDPTFLLLADDNAEDGEVDISRVALYDVALSQAEVEALGGLGGLDGFVTPPYLQNVKPDGITVMWETEVAGPGTVEYGTDPGYGSSVIGTVVDSGNQTWIHTAVLTGLTAETEHHCRVVHGSSVSEDLAFTTSPENESSFTFAVWSDSQGYNGGDYERDLTEPSKAMFDHMVASGIDFAVTCGDLAEDGGSYTDTRVFFVDRPIRRLAGEGVPFFTAWGNHDGGGESAVIRAFTDLPSKDAGPPFHGGYGSYSFDYGGCHFICIDYLREGEDVPGWVEADLQSQASRNARFRFLFVHRAPFYERWYNGQANLRTDLVPLLEQYEVNVCFSGHMHGYNRGLLNGVYYCVTGGASWLDHHEPLTGDWPHMTVGGYHDLAPDIEGGLIHEYVKVTVSPSGFDAELMTFHPDGTYREVLDEFGVTDDTQVGEAPGPDLLELAHAHPNPFNPRTWIDFTVDGEEGSEFPASLAIYDSAGRQVRVLMDGPLIPGRHRLPWDGRDHVGDSLPSGVYLYKLKAGPRSAQGKVTLIK